MEDTPTTPPPNPPPHTPPSEDFLSWSNWFRMLTGRMSLSERKTYLWAHDIKHEASDCRRCADHVSFLYKYSSVPPSPKHAPLTPKPPGPTIRFLRENIQQLHSDLPPSAVHCRRCTPPAPGKIGQYGGFSPHHGIMLCANEAVTRAEVEDALAHEMVHAYDHLRFRVDWADLRHAACTESEEEDPQSHTLG
ncbi:MAG: Mitochondrial inner membrane protease atp23 [Trizodia sp. TS-e1964]|nr:MAG: Mitochondrial inner membrane protease atp23 [Trizodia sp. TS-e1964]